MNVVKITVLKRALHADLAKELSNSTIRPCEVFHEGQEFIAGLNAPEGFCHWAWADISKMVLALQTGGSFDRGLFKNWMKSDNSAVACCTDGFRPVTFKLERVDMKSLVDSTGIDRPAPGDVYASERWGEFSYAFTGLAAGKRYGIRLHFCEIFHSGPARRRFAVEAGGKRVLDEFDIFREAGGAFRPVIREFEASADGNGTLRVNFIKGSVDQPKVSALEIVDSSAGKTVYAVNAGGPDGGSFTRDAFFTGGNVLNE